MEDAVASHRLQQVGALWVRWVRWALPRWISSTPTRAASRAGPWGNPATAALAGDLASNRPDDAESAVASPRWAPHVAAASALSATAWTPALTTSMGLRAHGSPIDVADLSSADTLGVRPRPGRDRTPVGLEYLDPVARTRALQQRSTHCRQRRGPARLLEDVVVATGAQRLVLVGHSMGGLVARSAYRRARRTVSGVPLVSDLVTLGSTPVRRWKVRGALTGDGPAAALGRTDHSPGSAAQPGDQDLRFGAMGQGLHGEIDTGSSTTPRSSSCPTTCVITP